MIHAAAEVLLGVSLFFLGWSVGIGQGRAGLAPRPGRSDRCIFCHAPLPKPRGLAWLVFRLAPPPFCRDYAACQARWIARFPHTDFPAGLRGDEEP